MVTQPLVTAEDLLGFPGAPFSPAVVESAADAIRTAVGWHIAPPVTETLTLDCDGGRVLLLPTLHLTAVSEVRDVSGDTPLILTGWRWSEAGMLSTSGCWPSGFRTVEVDITHGYDFCPAGLLPVIADWTQRRVMQESLGSRSVAFSADGDAPISATLDRFKLPPRP